MDSSSRLYRNTRELPVEVTVAGRESVRLESGTELPLERSAMFSWLTISILIPSGEAHCGYEDGNFRNEVFDGEAWKLWNVLPEGPPELPPPGRATAS